MDKLGRTYELLVETHDGHTLDIKLPTTIEFDIDRSTMGSTNDGHFRIYNLSENHRKQLRYNLTNLSENRTILLKAGYGKNQSIIFAGNVRQAWSVREGVEFITNIWAQDGGFAYVNGIISSNFPANTPQRVILENFMNSLPGVGLGAIGNFPGETSRGNSYTGSAANLLKENTGGCFFVDNGKSYCLKNNEYIGDAVPTIDASKGLLGTPYLEESALSFDMIFEPSLLVGQGIILKSATEKNYNGLLKIIHLKHKGMISEAVCGEAITTVRLVYGIDLTHIESVQEGG